VVVRGEELAVIVPRRRAPDGSRVLTYFPHDYVNMMEPVRMAQDVAKHLGLSLGRAVVGKFSDGEVMVEIMENVRGKDVFVLQSTCQPTNDNLMELMVMVDALKRSSAARVSAAIPYFGYARQDRRPRSARVGISAKVVANMLTSVGVSRVSCGVNPRPRRIGILIVSK